MEIRIRRIIAVQTWKIVPIEKLKFKAHKELQSGPLFEVHLLGDSKLTTDGKNRLHRTSSIHLRGSHPALVGSQPADGARELVLHSRRPARGLGQGHGSVDGPRERRHRGVPGFECVANVCTVFCTLLQCLHGENVLDRAQGICIAIYGLGARYMRCLGCSRFKAFQWCFTAA